MNNFPNGRERKILKQSVQSPRCPFQIQVMPKSAFQRRVGDFRLVGINFPWMHVKDKWSSLPIDFP